MNNQDIFVCKCDSKTKRNKTLHLQKVHLSLMISNISQVLLQFWHRNPKLTPTSVTLVQFTSQACCGKKTSQLPLHLFSKEISERNSIDKYYLYSAKNQT